MHILIIHQAFAALDEAGGTRHYEMAHYLTQQGHRVTIITSPVSYLTGKAATEKIAWVERDEPEPGICILRAYTLPTFHRSFIHRVLSFLSFMVSSFLISLGVKSVDLVWGTSPPIFQGVTAWLVARLKGVPFLFEVRDLWPAFAIAVGVLKNPLLIKASLWLEHFLYRHADRLIVNSPGFVEHVMRHGASQVDVIPNGVDTGMFITQDHGIAFRKAHAWNNQFIVLYAGAHGLSNDLGIVLDAASLLTERPDIEFVFIGDGKERNNLINQAQNLGLEHVHFLPPVPKTDMPEVIAAASACIAILKPLELYKTTYPNKVFDYMAAEKPVILAIDGVIRQMIEDAGAGMFVPPGDSHSLAQAILVLADDPLRAAQMGSSGKTFVGEHFERSKMTIHLNALLESMVRKGG
jgi:glycosyltransferase involved in cell wall biosynthesis